MKPWIAILAFLLLCSTFNGETLATPPNTSVGGAVAYEVGQGWITTAIDSGSPARWYVYGEMSGRSYCVETATGSLSPIAIETRVDVYTDSTGTTALTGNGFTVSNDVTTGEPIYVDGSRSCYIADGVAPTNALRYVKVSAPSMAAGDAGYVKFRVVETTLFAGYWTGKTLTTSPYGTDKNNTTNFILASNLRGITVHAKLTTWVGASTATGVDLTLNNFANCLCGQSMGTFAPNFTGNTGAVTGLVGTATIATDAPPGGVSAYAYNPVTGAFMYQLTTRN